MFITDILVVLIPLAQNHNLTVHFEYVT